MDKRFLSILAVIILIFAGIFVVSQHSSNSSTKGDASKATSHVTGNGQKNVTLMEYGDYQCPICGAYYQPLKQVYEQEFPDDIHFQFRNLPLVTRHPNAFAAARAAEAAGLQGKYWQMHDKLYENQDPNGQSGWVASNNPLEAFNTFAQQIGLNVNKFKTDYASSQVNDAINADIAAFLDTSYANHDASKQATPTFFLNGKYVANSEFTDPSTGQPNVEKFKSVINAEIAKQNKQ